MISTMASQTRSAIAARESTHLTHHWQLLCASLIAVAFALAPTAAASATEPPPSQPAAGPKGQSWQTEMAQAEHFAELREFDKAEEAAASALKQLKLTRPLACNETVYCQMKLAEYINRQDRFDDCLPAYIDALHTSEKCFGRTSKKLVPIYIALADVLEVDGNYKKAGQYYTAAINICDGADGANRVESVLPRRRMAAALAKQDRTKEAEDMDLLCLTILMKQNALANVQLLESVLSDYSSLVMREQQKGKSLVSSFQNELQRDELDSLQQKQGTTGSTFTTEVSAQLGQAALLPAGAPPPANLEGTGTFRLDQSPIKPDKPLPDAVALEGINKQRVDFYERLIATDIDSLGEAHPSVARDLSGLASIYIASRNYEQAKPLLARALEIYRKVYKEDAAPVKQTALLLDLLSQSPNQGNLTIDKTFLETLPAVPAEAQTIGVALQLNNLAFMLYCQGNLKTACTLFEWALSCTARATGETSLLTAASMIDASKLMRLNGRATEAEKLESTALSIARQDIINKRNVLLR